MRTNRYTIKRWKSNKGFMADINTIDPDISSRITMFYNTKASKDCAFKNVLCDKELSFENMSDLHKVSKELDMYCYSILTLYNNINGQPSVSRSKELNDYSIVKHDLFTQACRDIYVVLANDYQDITFVVNILEQYLRYGCEVAQVYDNKENKYVGDKFYMLTSTYQDFMEWKYFVSKKYNINEQEFYKRNFAYRSIDENA